MEKIIGIYKPILEQVRKVFYIDYVKLVSLLRKFCRASKQFFNQSLNGGQSFELLIASCMKKETRLKTMHEKLITQIEESKSHFL